MALCVLEMFNQRDESVFDLTQTYLIGCTMTTNQVFPGAKESYVVLFRCHYTMWKKRVPLKFDFVVKEGSCFKQVVWVDFLDRVFQPLNTVAQGIKNHASWALDSILTYVLFVCVLWSIMFLKKQGLQNLNLLLCTWEGKDYEAV